MKKIHLIRHAKSSWESEFLADIERPLNERGINACLTMAPHLNDAGVDFSNVFCSPAIRAQSTIELISQHLPEMAIEWKTDTKLYCFDSRDLLKWCRSIDVSLSEVLIIGHNPALTDLCNALSNSNVENIPTCGYVQLSAKSEFTWQNITAKCFDLTKFVTPKKLLKSGSIR